MEYRRNRNHMNSVDSADIDHVRLNPVGGTGREVFVANVHWEARESDLRDTLGEYGEIKYLRIVFDRATGRSKGFAFVTFVQPVSLEALQGAECMGRPLHIDWNRKAPRNQPQRPKRVQVKPKTDRLGHSVFAKAKALFRRLWVKLKTDRSGRSVPATQSVRDSAPASAQGPEAEIVQPSMWVEMTAPNGNGSAALVCYDPERSGLIRQHFEKLQRTDAPPWHGGNLGSAIADQLAGASGLVASGLQAGQMFQVIGTPHLVEGLKMGTHALMQTAEGTLGTVVSSSSGKIAGSLRFAKASMAPVLAPVLAWQILHGIAGTSQLRKINRRLDVMQRKLETIAARSEAGILGEVLNAVRTLDDILAEHANTGTFTRNMETRLALVEQTIGSVLERTRSLVDLFRSKASEVHRLGGKTGAVRTTNLLQEEGGQAVHDMEMLFGLAAADLRVEEARMHHAMEHNPADLQRRLNTVTAKIDNYHDLLRNLPSVESLESHAQACVEEMGWWQRKVFARGVGSRRTLLSGASRRQSAGSIWRELDRGQLRVLEGRGRYHEDPHASQWR